jgi:hypothetical protein
MSLWKKRPHVSSELRVGAKPGEAGEALRCSFCNKAQEDVKKLIAGPNVFICDECVETCREIIVGGGGSSGGIRYDGPRVAVRFGPRSKG